MLELVTDLVREYSNANDPWSADTILASPEVAKQFTADQLLEFEQSLERLGLVFLMQPDVPPARLVAERRDFGPWPDLADRAGKASERRGGSADTRQLLEILDHLLYVIECVASEIPGEAKFELNRLIEALERSQRPKKETVVAYLKESQGFLADRRYSSAATSLARARASLWKELAG